LRYDGVTPAPFDSEIIKLMQRLVSGVGERQC
jgi:hypothetical protein